jgi:hypothetical protein
LVVTYQFDVKIRKYFTNISVSVAARRTRSVG